MDGAKVEMPLETYHEMMAFISGIKESEGAHEEAVEAKKGRKKTKNDRALARGLSEANAKARLKNGSWRKGWNQKKVMNEAHRLRRKYTK